MDQKGMSKLGLEFWDYVRGTRFKRQTDRRIIISSQCETTTATATATATASYS